MMSIWREKNITSSDEIVCSVTPESHDQKKRKDERKDNRGSPQTKNLAP